MSRACRPAAATPTGRAADPVPTRHAWAVQTLLDAGATLIGKTITDEVSLGILGENAVRRHAGEPARAGPRAGRLVVGLGRRGRGRALRHRARHRYRRLGAGAGELLRALRHPPDAWPARRHRHDDAGAELGHDRLVRARRRDLRARLGGHARRGDPDGAADAAGRRGRRLRLRRSRRRRRAEADGRHGCGGAARRGARGGDGAAGPVGLGAGAAHAAALRGLARPSRTGSTRAIRALRSASRATW